MPIVCAHCGNDRFRLSRTAGEGVVAECLHCGRASAVPVPRKPAINVIQLVRRDLAFSMVSSTTLVAAAGVLSLTTTFAWVILVWSALAAAWLWLSARPLPGRTTTPLRELRVGLD